MAYRIRYVPMNPYVHSDVRGNNTYVGGLYRDVYDAMQTKTDFKYEAIPQPDLMYGSINGSRQWTGMIASMLNNETDVSGPYFINLDRASVVEYAVALDNTPLSIMSGLVMENRDASLVFRIFSASVWLLILVSVFSAAGVTNLISYAQNGYRNKGTLKTILKHMWMFQASLLGQGINERNRSFFQKIWNASSTRILLSVWFLGAGVVFNNTYKGGITSAFASQKTRPKIETFDDLLEHRTVGVSAYKNSYQEVFLKRMEHTLYDSVWQRAKKFLVTSFKTGTIPTWADDIEEGNLIFVAEIKHVKDLIGFRFLQTGKCGLRATPIEGGPGYIGIAFRKQLAHKKVFKTFNQVVRRYVEGDLTLRHFINSTLYYDMCTGGSSTSVVAALSLTDLLGAFMLLVAGIAVSSVVFLVELSVHRFQTRTFSETPVKSYDEKSVPVQFNKGIMKWTFKTWRRKRNLKHIDRTKTQFSKKVDTWRERRGFEPTEMFMASLC